MPKSKPTITPQTTLRLTLKWTGWHKDQGGLISEAGHRCCLAEAMLQAGFPFSSLSPKGQTRPYEISGFTKMGKIWRDSGDYQDFFVVINDYDYVEPDFFDSHDIDTSGFESDEHGNILTDTPERKIRALRAVAHLLGLEAVIAEPPEGYVPQY